MNARIKIDDVSVSYFLRKSGISGSAVEKGKVGANIQVAKGYFEIAALKDVTLTFNSGDRIGLVGTNGSGKSTFLKLLAGAVALQKGTINVEGRISPQIALSSGIKKDLSGRRNAELKCLYMGVPQSRIASYVEDVKELSGLGGYFELPIRSYSAGMRSRFVMSLMRLMRGDILVMDEWISTADATVNKTATKLQSELIDSASIVVMASHSKSILRDWTDTLVWLDHGTVKAVGPFENIYPKYEKWQKRMK